MTDASTPRAAGYRFAAEWEPHRATWLCWPHHPTDFPGKLPAVEWVFCEMIRVLSRCERVGLLVASPAERERALMLLGRAGVSLDRLEPVVAATHRSWTRDFLPTWLVPDQPSKPLGAVKWRFNGWARYDDHELDEAAGQVVAGLRPGPVWLPTRAPGGERFVLEGGAIDSDGEGTLLTTRQCLLGTQHPRNPGLGVGDIERVLGENLSVDRVIFLPGEVAGDDTSGHVDDLARFVAPGRVVVASTDDPSDENYRALAEAREALEGERDAKGRRLEVIRLPMPGRVTFEGEPLPASYANFYVANEQVLVPTFNDPRDYRALGLFAELFPEREVVGIHCRDLILGLGSIHCSTQQEPRVG